MSSNSSFCGTITSTLTIVDAQKQGKARTVDEYRAVLGCIKPAHSLLNTIKEKWAPYCASFNYKREDDDTIYIYAFFHMGDPFETVEWKRGEAQVGVWVNNQWKMMRLYVFTDEPAYDIDVRTDTYKIINAEKFEQFTLKCDLNMADNETFSTPSSS